MSERSRMPGGAPWAPPLTHRTAPGGWVGERPVEPDRAEPTDGRHAFDRDAALTPIFTALRRGGRRRLRTGAPALRLAPMPVEYERSDPPTAPIPVVPALHALDPYPSGGYTAASVQPYATGGYSPEPAGPHATGGYSPEPADPYAAGGYSPAPVDPCAYRYPAVRADPYALSGSYAAAPPPSRAETTTVWPRHDGPMPHTSVTDTGRHHRRLAPAGW